MANLNYKNEPILELDVHGLNVEQAMEKIRAAVRKAPQTTYRIRVIHGYNSGTHIKGTIKREFNGNGIDDRILRIEPGWNEGITELILREY